MEENNYAKPFGIGFAAGWFGGPIVGIGMILGVLYMIPWGIFAWFWGHAQNEAFDKAYAACGSAADQFECAWTASPVQPVPFMPFGIIFWIGFAFLVWVATKLAEEQ